jgi:A/G-specific adenine glycosylase
MGSRIDRIREALLSWYLRKREWMPWREDPAPWRVLVSELMLQQTTVKAVIPYFERFLARFPEPADLAAADQDEVLALWSGLGYYRRARMLQDAARRIVAEHGGLVPDDPAILRDLPGVGPYTVAAVASIAFGRPLAVVDGNVERVMARLFALPGRRGDTALGKAARDKADALLDRDAPGDFNQAVMELGRLVCAPRSPKCPDCPVSGRCDSYRDGKAETRPAPPVKKRPVGVIHMAALVRRGAWILLKRRPDGGRMPGMLELPTAIIAGEADKTTDLERLMSDLDLDAHIGDRLATVRHAILDERVTLHVHEVTLIRPRRRRSGDAWRFVRASATAGLPLTAATTKSLSATGIDLRRTSA